MNKINDFYSAWCNGKSEQRLSDLLEQIRKRVIQRYCIIDPSNADDIAQETVLEIWKSLEQGKSFKQFAAYCATVARRRRQKQLRHERLYATKDSSLEDEINKYSTFNKGY